MTSSSTHMRREILQIPEVIAGFLKNEQPHIEQIANTLRAKNPDFISTIARGSSDHAATFFKYACELNSGIPVASIGPSTVSIFNAPLKLGTSVCIAISQSGRSPDIVETAALASNDGALTIAITNEIESELAAVCQHTININAGVETSVAATKTFVASAIASLYLIALWREDASLIAALKALPLHLEKATKLDWPSLREQLIHKSTLYVLGRGPTMAMSNEAALKFKETCQIQAASYSSAEVLHGPVSIISPNYPVLAFVSRDAAESSIISVVDKLAAGGATVFATSENSRIANRLDFVKTDHPLTDPLSLIVSFYAFIERLALERGLNPDTPRNLKKVTETV